MMLNQQLITMADQKERPDQARDDQDKVQHRDPAKKRPEREISSKGGQISGGRSANDPERAAEAGREGVKERDKDRD